MLLASTDSRSVRLGALFQLSIRYHAHQLFVELCHWFPLLVLAYATVAELS